MSVSTEAAELAALLVRHSRCRVAPMSRATRKPEDDVAYDCGARVPLSLASHHAHVAAVLLAEGWHRGGEVEALDEVEDRLRLERVDAHNPHRNRGKDLWGLNVATRIVGEVRTALATPPAQDGAR